MDASTYIQAATLIVLFVVLEMTALAGLCWFLLKYSAKITQMYMAQIGFGPEDDEDEEPVPDQARIDFPIVRD